MAAATPLLDIRSQLATSLLAYLKNLADSIDDVTHKPVYFGWRKPSALYIEPDVLRRKKAIDALDKEQKGERHEKPHQPWLSDESLEIGEHRELPKDEIELRVRWRDECESLGKSERRCAVILGPPGQGKSHLASVTAAKLARESWLALQGRKTAISELPLPIFLTFEELTSCKVGSRADAEQALRHSLASVIRGTTRGRFTPAEDYISCHAHEQRIWLFLDALDQLPGERLPVLGWFLSVLNDWACRLVLTSRPYAYDAHSIPFDAALYRLAPFAARQQEHFVKSWHTDDEQRNRILELFTRSSSIQRMAENPFLLTMLCWLCECHDLSPEITRSEIYELITVDMLGLPPGGVGMIDRTRGHQLKPLVAWVAWEWFRRNKGNEALPAKPLLQLLSSSLPASGKGPGSLLNADPLLEELSRKRMLIPFRADRSSYYIPQHRSILEYFTASALADRLMSPDPDTKKNAWSIVDKKSWDPDWKQVFLFLAPQLDGNTATQLISQLADPERQDDFFCHPLMLATQCLAEVGGSAPFPDHLDGRVASSAFELLWTDLVEYDGNMFQDSEECWSAIARISIRRRGGPLHQLLRRLLGGRVETQMMSARALGAMGREAARHPKVIPALLRSLRDDNIDLRLGSLAALGSMSPEAARHPKVIPTLLRLLAHEVNVAVLVRVQRVLAPMSAEAAGHPDMISFLLQHAANCGWPQGEYLAATLGAAANAAAGHCEVIPTLLEWLRDDTNNVRMRCLSERALGAMGSEAARHPEVIPALLESLRQDSPDRRWWSAYALGQMGAEAARHPEVIPTLLESLHNDGSMKVRAWSAGALGQMGAEGVRHPEMIPVLLRSLSMDEDDSVRVRSAEALGAIGREAARHPEVIPALLLSFRKDKNTSNVRSSMAKALSAMGEEAARHPKVIPTLLGCLLDDEEDLMVRVWSAEAVGTMGAAAAKHPGVIEVLLRSVRTGGEAMVREASAYALGQLGEGAAKHNEVLPTLLAMMWKGELCSTSAEALGAMGRETARHPEVIPSLLKILCIIGQPIPNNSLGLERFVGLFVDQPLTTLKVPPFGKGAAALLGLRRLGAQHTRPQAPATVSAAKALASMGKLGVRIFQKSIRWVEDLAADQPT